MDDLLDAIMWGLGINPEQFFQVDGKLWLAKTDPYPGAPALRVWFRLDSDNRQIDLLAIERIGDDEGLDVE